MEEPIVLSQSESGICKIGIQDGEDFRVRICSLQRKVFLLFGGFLKGASVSLFWVSLEEGAAQASFSMGQIIRVFQTFRMKLIVIPSLRFYTSSLLDLLL